MSMKQIFNNVLRVSLTKIGNILSCCKFKFWK